MRVARAPRAAGAAAALALLALALAGCGRKAPVDDTVVLPAETPFRANLALWPDTPERPGRTGPAFSHYRPQLRFAGAPDRTCTLMIPAPATALPPGPAMDVLFGCDGELRVHRAQPEFEVLEGGKKVGQGRALLP